ncbi:MAG: DUF86 domain-containing protein [Chloroflexota bacterium]|nr:DUF86 domain-containing protein [Chloroflexota bacterium]
MTKDAKGYLDDLVERIDRIVDFSAAGREEFLTSRMNQDAILRNFEVIGEIVKRLGHEFAVKYPDVPWRRIAGFRDVLIHNYEGVSMEVVWEVIENELLPLREKILKIRDKLEQSQ